ncbi:hypothetical protein [uncultured Stenotrophomonas sp.]|uniref:hypothetical protein n=1 Tax=uncultured Stenotrophomonas sp. TaxID=165438 RepID=UPI0028E872C4|nr:hypothetical protein [uncultured Stenotrophomonas sp.]
MSTPAAPPLWTPAQQSWLQAMGYTVFVDGSVEAAPEPVVELGTIPVEPGPARRAADARGPDAASAGQSPALRPSGTAAPPRRNAPAAEDAVAPTSTPTRTGTRRPAVRMPPPLQIALLRASGCNPNDPETQALMASWNLDELRGNAAAKRALWPQLRALRKRGRA